MRAAVISALTGPDAVEVREVPEPVPTPGQVLVDVEYAGVVFPDVLQTRGEYQLRPELPFTPGWEVSGVVRECAGGFRAGDRVAAMPVVGGLAKTAAVDAHMVFSLPDEVPMAKAAALPLNYLTAQFALVRRARLQSGETVLVHGAAGGVGTAACQLAAALGARVLASNASPGGPLQISDELEPQGSEGSELTYMHGVAITNETLAPDDLQSIAAPAGSWAVFTTEGPHPQALQDTWAATAAEWFPSNPWRLRPGPSIVAVLEHNKDFTTATCELWQPVERT